MWNRVKERTNTSKTAEIRHSRQLNFDKDKIKISSFAKFKENIPKKFQEFAYKTFEEELTLFRTDPLRKKLRKGACSPFKEIDTLFGFLKVQVAEKDGIEVSKRDIGVPKNSLLYRWSQLCNIRNKVYSYEHSNDKYLENVIEVL